MRLVEKLRLLRIVGPIGFWALVAGVIAGMTIGLGLLALTVAAAISAGFLLIRARLERPARRQLAAPGPGPCPTCGYPGADRPAAPCPECGDRTPLAGIRSVWDRRLGYWWTSVPF